MKTPQLLTLDVDVVKATKKRLKGFSFSAHVNAWLKGDNAKMIAQNKIIDSILTANNLLHMETCADMIDKYEKLYGESICIDTIYELKLKLMKYAQK